MCFASVCDVLSEVVIVLYDVALLVSRSKNMNPCFRCLEVNYQVMKQLSAQSHLSLSNMAFSQDISHWIFIVYTVHFQSI